VPSEERDVTATTVPAALLELAAADGDATALLAKRRGLWERTTRRALLERVAVVARGLEQHGITAGDTVVVAAADQPAWLEMDLAVQVLGARVCPLSAASDDARLRAAFERTGAEVVVASDQELVDRLLDLADAGGLTLARVVEQRPSGGSASADPRVTPLAEVADAGAGADLAWLRERIDGLAPDDVAVVHLGAGSDGGVAVRTLRHGAVATAARAVVDAVGLRPDDRVLSVRPLADPTERTTTIGAALVAGAVLALPERRDQASAALAELAPTYVHVTRRWLDRTATEVVGRLAANRGVKAAVTRGWVRRFTDGDGPVPAAPWLRGPVVRKLGLDHARALVVSGAPLGRRERRFADAFGLPVRAAYALGETGGIVTLSDGLPDEVGDVGTALPGVDLQATDGTLVVSGPATSEPVTTDDLAHLQAGGPVVTGRRDEQLVVEGRTVSLPAAETALRRSPYVREAVVAVAETDDRVEVTVEPVAETVERWASRRGITFATFRALADTDEVQALLRDEIGPRAREAGLGEVGEVHVLPVALEEVPGALSLSGRVRREVVRDAGRARRTLDATSTS
jgi:long-chain acyl-CoA synthetase